MKRFPIRTHSMDIRERGAEYGNLPGALSFARASTCALATSRTSTTLRNNFGKPGTLFSNIFLTLYTIETTDIKRNSYS